MSVELIQRALSYMEEHICEDISYAEVAKVVRMSSYNFHRTFSFIVGMTANDYIRRRRLTLAAQELQTTDISVIDVALKYGYESPESFSKAFSKFHGSTPKQAKHKGAKLHLFNPLVAKFVLEGGSIMDYRIEQTEEQKFIALVRSFRNEIINDEENHEIPDFWGECHDKNLVDPIRNLRPEGKRDLYGLCSPKKEGEDMFEYGIGVLIDEDTSEFDFGDMEKAGYRIWDVKPGTYAVFDCFGEDSSCISETWSKFYKEFLPQTGYCQTDDTDYEIYFEDGEKGLFCELWVPVKQHKS